MSDIPTWVEENRSLHDIVCQARVSMEVANDLQHQLQMNKQRFINLLDAEGKNSAHRATLNSNKAYINRSQHNVSKDFVTKALFLSDQLDINEHAAATLLMRGTTEASRISSSNALDTAVVLYHDERGYLLACLDAILRSAKDNSVGEEVGRVCYQYMDELMRQPIQMGNETVTFVGKLIATLDHLTKSINAIQNTGSVDGQVPEPASGKLGDDISQLRIDRLGDERIYTVQILYHITSLYHISTQDKITMLGLLEEAELTDPATAYVITAMIASISFENSQETPDMEFINSFHHRIMTRSSRAPVIKAVIVLQWVLYLTNPIRSVQVIGGTGNPNRTDEIILQLLDRSIAQDVFGFMNCYLLYFQQPNAMIDTDRKVIKYDNSPEAKNIDKSNYRNFNADIRIEFHPFVIHELETLGNAMISVQFNHLQLLKYKEEDTTIPVQTPLTTNNAISSNNTEGKQQCHDLEYFLVFMASVYRDRVNAGAIFWSREQDGLHSFARWLLDIKAVYTVCAAFDFFSSIATGDVCAKNMYQFFSLGLQPDLASSTLFSWGKPLAALQFYTGLLKQSSEEAHATIPATEEDVILKFLLILKQTVQYSTDARDDFWYSTTIRCQYILLDILNCPTSTQLRAALFDVLTAFCSAWGGGVNGLGRRISSEVWRFLEDSDMLFTKRKIINDNESVARPAGILQELEAEKISRIFTETLSVIRLIGSAIHPQSKREALISGFAPPPSSIPADLGKGTKRLGAAPFISLIIDDIFASLSKQQYAYAEGRWQLTEACLMVMENSIESFDLEYFESNLNMATLNKELKAAAPNPAVEAFLLPYLIHSGFQVVIRILKGGRLVDELFNIIEQCAEKKTKEVEHMPYHKQCLLRALRILLKVLRIQKTFCMVLIPYIMAFSKRTESAEYQLGEYIFARLPSVISLGELMLFKSSVLTHIALLVNYADQEEICFLSTEIFHSLTADDKNGDLVDQVNLLAHVLTTASFKELGPTLTKVLQSSPSADTIIFGVSEQLRLNQPEVMSCDDYEFDTSNIPFWLAKETISNTYSYATDFLPRISYSVPLAILNLLLQNAEADKASPNLTEFLLGYDLTTKNLHDTDKNKASLVCLHTLLDMMRQGVDKQGVSPDAMVEDTAEPSLPFIDTHPILAEKCYELIYRLCSKESRCLSTLRYLRNTEDFFCRQFDLLSSRVEYNIEVEEPAFPGVMTLADGTEVTTDFFRLRSKLHQRAWILQGIALELHNTIGSQQKNDAKQLLELLYGRKKRLASDDMDISEQQNIFSISSTETYQQPLVKMLELVSSLDFAWEDERSKFVPVKELVYWQGFDQNQYMVKNDYGCDIYDIRAVYQYLRSRQPENNEQAETEMGAILNWCMAFNHGQEIAHAKLHCLDAWKMVVDVTLTECFDLMDRETGETMIYELLTMLLTKIVQINDGKGKMLQSMSEIVNKLIDRLKKDKKARPASELPVERLIVIFGGIVDGIRQQDTTFEIRGNLYSAMTNFLLFIKGHGRDKTYENLEQYIISQITSAKSKLLDIVCKDVLNGLHIWKTTAFIGLDALNNAALSAGSNGVQHYLIKENFLQYVIQTIRADDADLTTLLEQDDADLLPLYIHEAKMSILLGMAMNPDGAELLYSNRIFQVLAQCQFMKAQQHDLNMSNVLQYESTVELADRYEQLLLPTLKVIFAVLYSCGRGNNEVLGTAEEWARQQQDALVNILNERKLTAVALEKIRLVTSIMFAISRRSGFYNDLVNRGINRLHNTLSSMIIPETVANNNTYNAKEKKMISEINRALDSYKKANT